MIAILNGFARFWCVFKGEVEKVVRSPRYGQLRYFLKARFVENEKLNNFPLWSKDKFPIKFSRFGWFPGFDFLLSARARARARPPTVTGAGSAHFPERGINSFLSCIFARARFTWRCSIFEFCVEQWKFQLRSCSYSNYFVESAYIK